MQQYHLSHRRFLLQRAVAAVQSFNHTRSQRDGSTGQQHQNGEPRLLLQQLHAPRPRPRAAHDHRGLQPAVSPEKFPKSRRAEDEAAEAALLGGRPGAGGGAGGGAWRRRGGRWSRPQQGQAAGRDVLLPEPRVAVLAGLLALGRRPRTRPALAAQLRVAAAHQLLLPRAPRPPPRPQPAATAAAEPQQVPRERTRYLIRLRHIRLQSGGGYRPAGEQRPQPHQTVAVLQQLHAPTSPTAAHGAARGHHQVHGVLRRPAVGRRAHAAARGLALPAHGPRVSQGRTIRVARVAGPAVQVRRHQPVRREQRVRLQSHPPARPALQLPVHVGERGELGGRHGERLQPQPPGVLPRRFTRRRQPGRGPRWLGARWGGPATADGALGRPDGRPRLAERPRRTSRPVEPRRPHRLHRPRGGVRHDGPPAARGRGRRPALAADPHRRRPVLYCGAAARRAHGHQPGPGGTRAPASPRSTTPRRGAGPPSGGRARVDGQPRLQRRPVAHGLGAAHPRQAVVRAGLVGLAGPRAGPGVRGLPCSTLRFYSRGAKGSLRG
ncbi:hypothetical protein FOCC_FOCC000714 [Frankliniella occidentalis]|nr:hypothetical protein FOCC_FOCC000714 [Frankliniella occidentalis]